MTPTIDRSAARYCWAGRTAAAIGLCAVLALPAIISAEMPRVSVRINRCLGDRCSRAALGFTHSSAFYVAEVRVKRHADNRRLVVTLYCDGLIVDGPADMPQEGELAVPIRTREYRHLGPGHYVATAFLVTASGDKLRAAPTEFTVIDSSR